MTTTLYELRHDDRIVPFHGELLGEASSHEAGRMRWHEIRIYQTDAGSFVVERVGKSIILGETDRSKVYFYPTPQDVEDGLTSIDKDGQCKCSLRSNGDYDVSAIAKAFGGGGHRNAAGFTTDIQTLLEWIK